MAYTTINKSTDYFNTVLYTGTGATQTISGVGHQPDFIWVKQRGDAGYDHSLHNSVSGLLKQLISNTPTAEITNTDTVTSNNADGFVLGADSAGPNANSNNQNTKTYAAWNWKANGQGSSNTVGTINTTYTSANTTAGFSIVSYPGNGVAGATVGHGLGVAPKVIIIKQLTGATNFTVYHSGLGNFAKYLYLDATNAVATDSGNFDNVPNANTFLLGSNNQVNASSGSKYIAYCFAEKQGYSKFGSYTGNGNANGTFIYTGFKPAWVMVKRSSDSQGWVIWDDKRPGYNLTNKSLTANENGAEETGRTFDMLSNGFKIRDTNTATNASGSTYIYMAFGQSLVGSNNVPCTAR